MSMKEFTNCHACGKIVNARSHQCHHCGSRVNARPEDTEAEYSESFAEGGYAPEEDDFDYQEFVESEFESGTLRIRKIWFYVAWLLVLILLLPFILNVIGLAVSSGNILFRLAMIAAHACPYG